MVFAPTPSRLSRGKAAADFALTRPFGYGSCGSPLGAADHIHQFSNLAALIGLVAGHDSVLDAMGDMVAQDLLLNTAQCRFRRRDLGDDVDTIAIVLDHARKPADLALDSFQPFQAGRLDLLAHRPHIPP